MNSLSDKVLARMSSAPRNAESLLSPTKEAKASALKVEQERERKPWRPRQRDFANYAWQRRKRTARRPIQRPLPKESPRQYAADASSLLRPILSRALLRSFESSDEATEAAKQRIDQILLS
jgi:hypothetical protein